MTIAPVAADLRCASCDQPRAGAYCAACGQPTLPARLTTRDVLTRHVAGAVDIDRGILHTAVSLFRHPGTVIRDYLRGRTIPYTNPVKYFVLAMTLVQLIALATGAVGDFVAGLTEGSSSFRAGPVSAFLDRYWIALSAPCIPITAALQRRLFRRSALNFAEHLVFALFVTAQLQLLAIPTLPASGGNRTLIARTLLAVFGVAAPTYYVWAARQTFGYPLGATVLRSAAVLVLTAISYTLLVTLILAVFTR